MEWNVKSYKIGRQSIHFNKYAKKSGEALAVNATYLKI